MNRQLIRGLAALVLGASGLGAQTVAITGGTVYTASGARIENGTVVIQNGKITAVGAGVAVPADARRIDATGKWVTPGFINSSTTLGLLEIGFGGPDNDLRARTNDDGIAAAFRAWEGINPQSQLFGPSRVEGITTVLVHPDGGLISGQAAMIDLVEGTATDMIRAAPVGMMVNFGTGGSTQTEARGELFARLREVLEDTKQYQRRRADFERAQTRPFVASRLDLEAMIPVVEGRLPLLVNVDKASDIEALLSIQKEYAPLKVIILGGLEGWIVADKLAAARVPILVGALRNIPDFNALGARQENAALLRRAGVQVGILGSGADAEGFNVRNVRQDAGNAVAYGMSWDDALRAVTQVPAEIFGLDNRIGSIAVGKDANVVVWSGDPFEFSTNAEHVLVRGREFTAPTRQDLLVQRYRHLPANYKQPR